MTTPTKLEEALDRLEQEAQTDVRCGRSVHDRSAPRLAARAAVLAVVRELTGALKGYKEEHSEAAADRSCGRNDECACYWCERADATLALVPREEE